MNLKEFVAESLAEIVLGISEDQSRVENTGAQGGTYRSRTKHPDADDH